MHRKNKLAFLLVISKNEVIALKFLFHLNYVVDYFFCNCHSLWSLPNIGTLKVEMFQKKFPLPLQLFFLTFGCCLSEVIGNFSLWSTSTIGVDIFYF
jgi:hypothetical protein